MQREIDFCRKKIESLATNHSVWYYYTQIVCQYLKRYFNKKSSSNDEEKEHESNGWTQQRQEQIKWIQGIINKQPYAPRASLFYIDLLTDKENTNLNDLNQAKAILAQLSEKLIELDLIIMVI